MNIQKTFKIIFISLFIILFLGAVGVFFLLRLYNINLDQGEHVLKMGLNLDFVTIEEIDEYYENNIGKIDVISYDLDIKIDKDNESISASAKIKFIPIYAVNGFISLDFSSDFKNIIVSSDNKNLNFKKLSDQINIQLPENKKDTIIFEISYEGEPENKGLGSFMFTDDDVKDEKRILTLNEPIFASSWFPCNDYPDDKAMLTISITNDSSYTTISNGILVSTKIVDDQKTYTWKTVYPISTYLIGFYSAPYSVFKDSIKLNSGESVPIEYYILNSEKQKSIYDLEVSKQALEFFDKTFGTYPFAKEKYAIAEFDWQFGAIENQTAVGIGSQLISGNRFFSDVIVHEAAHHWWGNAVGPKSWEDIWLNEGFSSYSEALYWEYKSGRSSLISTLFAKKYDFNDTQLYDPRGMLFSSTIYNKGAWVLHMLRFEIGEKNFFELMREYFEKYKYSNASTEDFKNLLEEKTKKDFSKFFDQWIYKGTGFIYADYNFTINNGRITVNIDQFQDGYEVYNFPLEIEYVGKNESLLKRYFISSKDTAINFNPIFEIVDVKLDPNNWLLANFIKEDSK